MSEVLIRCEKVGKKFCRDMKRSLWYGVKDSASALFKRRASCSTESRPIEVKLRSAEFWANHDINIEVKRGECLGLIGRNGAGKTTLLKILNGLIRPDTGCVTLRGSVGAMIALGAGFNPVLTGRENIYVNGAILGLKKSMIDKKLEEIVGFSEIRESIDSPVRTYSSGMQVRLGFAVAAILIKPDILILDEVLAVGDSAFKIKCYNQIRQLLAHTAVVIVSHTMFDIARICTSAAVLQCGKTQYIGCVKHAIHVYNELNRTNERAADGDLVIHHASGIAEVELIKFECFQEKINTHLDLSIRIKSLVNWGEVRLRLVFFDEQETAVAEWDSKIHEADVSLPVGDNEVSCTIENLRLAAGNYRTAVVVTYPDNNGYIVNIEHGLQLKVVNDAIAGAPYKV